MLDDTKLVWDLQRVNQIALSFSTSLDLEKITHLATEGLVQYFDCAFARIWLVEPDRKGLKLIASSGLYTRIDGTFSRISMGAFKIGRIAQNRVSLLSNHLAEESWVGDRDWAIANKINGFAGYPLASADKVIGVLAAFSHEPMSPEFLTVISSLCTTLSMALAMASRHQQEKQMLQASKRQPDRPYITLAQLSSLSDSLAYILGQTTLSVVGTERHLDLSQIQVFLQVAERLKTLECTYCRLTYEETSISLDAIAAPSPAAETNTNANRNPIAWETSLFGHLAVLASGAGGTLTVNTEAQIKGIQVSLNFPSSVSLPTLPVSIQCQSPLLQTGLTHLAYSAGLSLCSTGDRHTPLLTDQCALGKASERLIWVKHGENRVPREATAQINLSATSEQLRAAVEAVMKGDNWGLSQPERVQQRLSQREQEVITLLVKGLRDRDIASQLYISDSTVKFHINNILNKLKAKTRLQALYELMRTGELVL